MKYSIIASCMALFLSNIAFSQDFITHNAVAYSIVKNGSMIISTRDLSEDDFELSLKYKITLKVLFITKILEGEMKEILPMKFRFSYGHEELREVHSMKYKNIEITHLGMLNLEEFADCHRVHLKPLAHNKWEGEVTYCPDVAAIGFARTKLTYKKVPFFGQHTMQTVLSD